ncbi:uncharacterized protein EV420DRAFT_1530856 [Desarmillaria tabescens]|uniref:Uncharacterized protein n=1 Tax=Armillaria tabescens TaxID=1929756 RepID=A0AA39N8W7_ARMTA|nr:uncharacterized protein EV420DRAFT_1530856 [Desarmillaria tabescens]KAK0461197.1 hypothetical protein EV420DRAFT_1530856 [Desarmillaria tabescens]
MTRTGNINDVGFGRRREDDSSSSRESSPRPAQKRSFSPTSDDGDLEIPPLPDDDTPPPPERPIIRQAVAFTTITPANIDTYEPTEAPRPATSFLPGQVVTQPEAPKRKTRSKKTKHSDSYPDQVGRFRIKSYDPTASTAPPMQQGNGPYSSIYRAVPYKERNLASGANAQGSPNTQSSLGESTKSTSKSPTSSSAVQTNGTSTAMTSTSPSPNAVPPTNSTLPNFNSGPSAPPALTSSRPSLSGASRPHYRRDYDKDPLGFGQFVNAQRGSPAGSDATLASAPAHSPLHAQHNGILQGTDLASKAPRNLPRMVTLLISDIRSGIVDRQLAEVKVPLKMADTPDDGFWADAKDICDKLQSGPSRIDGPAKVYTLRGRYRQFFLRVSADNVDETISSNLSITNQRTIDIVVEQGPTPGQIPAQPLIPRELRSPSPDLDQAQRREPDLVQQREHELVQRREHELAQRREYEHQRRSHDHRRDYEHRHEYDRAQHRYPIPSSSSHSSHPYGSSSGDYSRRSEYSKKRRHSPVGDYDYDYRHSQPPPPSMSPPHRSSYPPPPSPSHRSSYPPSPPSPRSSYPPMSPHSVSSYPPPRPISPGPRAPRPPAPSPYGPNSYHPSFGHPPPFGPNSYHPSVGSVPPKKMKSYATTQKDPMFVTPSDKYGREWDYESPDSDDEAVDVFDKICKRVDPLLQLDRDWKAMFQWRSLPQTVTTVLNQYRFAQRLFDRYEGERVPFKNQKHQYKIERKHIIRALQMDPEPSPEKWASDCTETLKLLELYGPDGSRTQDDRVKKMMDDETEPVYNAKPIKRFLRLLREIDQEYTKSRGPQAGVAMDVDGRSSGSA